MSIFANSKAVTEWKGEPPKKNLGHVAFRTDQLFGDATVGKSDAVWEAPATQLKAQPIGA